MLPTLSSLLNDDEKRRLRHLAGLEEAAPVMEVHDMWSLPHPKLSRPEILRLDSKLDTAGKHLDALDNIFQELHEDDLDPEDDAVKVHHLVHKGELDMSLFADMRKRIDELINEFEDLRMQWLSSIQSVTDPDLQDDPEQHQPPQE